MEDKIHLTLGRASEDPAVSSPEFQVELRKFASSLRDAEIPYTQRAIAFDAVDAAGYPLAEFTIAITPITLALIGLLKEWIKGRAGRKVKVKIGDRSIEAGSVEDVEKLLPQILAEKSSKSKKP